MSSPGKEKKTYLAIAQLVRHGLENPGTEKCLNIFMFKGFCLTY